MSNCCIRGAITVNENTRENILDNTRYLLSEIIQENNVDIEDIVSILFTATKDVDMAYPAVAAREIGIVNASLMCVQEMYVQGSLNMCIRVMMTIETNKRQKDMQHIYLGGASVLRPDIAGKRAKKTAIAIDGPAGSGKSTVAKLIAKEMGYIYVDTGAMYRTVGLYCIKNDIDYTKPKEVEAALDYMDISLIHEENKQRIYLNGEDVTENIRTQEVADSASAVATMLPVRNRLVELQRKIAEKSSIVMDGRDIGTNVLPNADVKIYMDAEVAERAKRRCSELEEKGIEYNFYQILDEIIKRDKNDKNRAVNPLTVADDAVILDTTGKTVDGVKADIMAIIKEKMER